MSKLNPELKKTLDAYTLKAITDDGGCQCGQSPCVRAVAFVAGWKARGEADKDIVANAGQMSRSHRAMLYDPIRELDEVSSDVLSAAEGKDE